MTIPQEFFRVSPLAPLVRQVVSYVGIGLVATACHYVILIVLVQASGVSPVRAALCGYLVGGVISYNLNRSHTFASERPHREAVWRFVLVAAVGFVLTFVFMWQMVDRWALPYLVAQVVTTALIMVWTFSANRFWTFKESLGAGS